MNQNTRTFEESMQRLAEIVRTMERGDAPLEEALNLFEEGTALIRSCGKLLDDAKMQVSKLSVSEDGMPVEDPFDDDEIAF